MTLRNTARDRWTRNAELRRRRDMWQRFASAFVLGIVATTLAMMLISATAQHFARPVTEPIKYGLSHDGD